MRITIINRHPNDVFGGSEMQCHNIADGLMRRGHEVLYVAPYGAGHYDTAYRVAPTKPSSRAIAAAALQSKPDIVYWRFNKYHFYRTVRELDRADVPVVFAISNIDDTRLAGHTANPRAGVVSLMRAVRQRALNLFNHLGFRHVAAVTSLNPDYLGLLPVRHQIFVPNSVQLESRPFSWPRPYMAWVANLKPVKRPELYVKLAQDLGNKGVDFLMIGDIQTEEYRCIADTDAQNFHYLGRKSLEETNGIIGNALALVHTGRPEGFGNNFLQAWLQGVPTVSLGFDPAGYIEQHGLGGYADGNWERFMAQVTELIDDRDGTRQAGQRAREFAQAQFSIERTVETLEGLMQNLIAARRTREESTC